MLLIVYYLITSLCVIIYFLSLRLLKLKLISYSTLTYTMAILLIMIPGYQIVSGTEYNLVRLGFSRGFDFGLFCIYLSFIIISTFGLLLGQLSGKHIFLKTTPRAAVKKRAKIILILVIIYSIAYFCWLPVIPINNLMVGTDIYTLTIERMQVTHSIATSFKIPVLFRYWRSILQPVFLAFFILLTLHFNFRKCWSKLLWAVIGIFLIYCSIFTLEKAPVIYILIAFVFVSYILQPPGSYKKLLLTSLSKRNLLIVGIGVFAIIVMYKNFMGAGMEDIATSLNTVWSRLATQSASTYLQIEYVRNYTGFLWLRGIDMPFIKNIFNYELIDLSKMAITDMYPTFAKQGYVGAAGGLSLAQLYFCFSWLAFPLFFFFTYVIGYIDSILLNTIYRSKKSDPSRNVNIAFYTAFSAYNSTALLSSVFTIFTIPTILNPGIIIYLFFYFLLIKSNIKIYKVNTR